MIALGGTDFFSGRRAPLIAREAAVATSHPLATAAGLEILATGGNAVDAALAAVAVQCVVEPHMTGIGGDCFVLLALRGGATVALNGSGRAPAAASVARLRALGLEGEIPQTSPHAVTVPGAVSAWTRLHADHGRLPLDRLFARAVAYAEGGYPVAPRVAADWQAASAFLARDEGTRAVFLPGGAAPAAGERHAQPRLGTQLRAIARDGAAAFYEGATAAALVRFLAARGGLHTEEDFAEGRNAAFYTTPIATRFRGLTVEECPPGGQGLTALMLLNILSEFDLGPKVSEADRVHIQAEATKLAYHTRDAVLCDGEGMTAPVDELLSPETARRLARRIDMGRALPPALWDAPEHRDTVYIRAVDREGTTVSFINSIFHAFGSGLLEPETGILLHSRGHSFRLLEGHPNAIAPRRRPLHTIIPGLLRDEKGAVGVFGVMGGHYQAAGHAALLSGLLDRGLNPQAALDAPRFFAFEDRLEIEPGFSGATLADLKARGHRLLPAPKPIGGGQVILLDREKGCLVAGSDSRKDGCALGF